jgi:hypothetical protein
LIKKLYLKIPKGRRADIILFFFVFNYIKNYINIYYQKIKFILLLILNKEKINNYYKNSYQFN